VIGNKESSHLHFIFIRWFFSFSDAHFLRLPVLLVPAKERNGKGERKRSVFFDRRKKNKQEEERLSFLFFFKTKFSSFCLTPPRRGRTKTL